MNKSLRGLRIARVSSVSFFVATQLREQILTHAAMGAAITVVTSDGPELDKFANVDNVSIERIEIPRSIDIFRDVVALYRLWRLFRSKKFDIVHSTTPKAGLLCAIAGCFARVPVRIHTFTGQPWVSMTGLVRFLGKSADWFIGRLNTRCYADSIGQLLFLTDQKLLSRSRSSVLGEGSIAGVDMRRFDARRWTEGQNSQKRRDLGLTQQGCVLLFVGRITRDKGIFELLQSFDVLQGEGWDVDLLLVGPEDDERNGGVDISGFQRVHRTGYTDMPERFMALADVLCLPSYREGFGTVVIEAAAMGLPTVGTAIYGLSDAVDDGVTGLLVPPADVVALTGALRELVGNRKKAMAMGLAARLRCAKYFDCTKVNAWVAREYVRLIAH